MILVVLFHLGLLHITLTVGQVIRLSVKFYYIYDGEDCLALIFVTFAVSITCI